MKKIETEIKYFAYVRKSSEGQERQALSIPAQKEKINKMFPSLNIEFIEEEKSAFKPYNRPGLESMLQRMEKGERNGFIFDLKFATYHFENNPEGIWMLQMALSQSQYESAKKGRDVKRGLEMKAKMV